MEGHRGYRRRGYRGWGLEVTEGDRGLCGTGSREAIEERAMGVL